jgi:hypothetical protein
VVRGVFRPSIATHTLLKAIPNPANKPPLVSAPTNHEVAGFMPGRLEFEHELENDAELAVKDMEFGLVYAFDGDQQPESAAAPPAEPEPEQEEETEEGQVKVKAEPGTDDDGDQKKQKVDPGTEVEDPDELQLKLAMLDIYYSKLDKREYAKDLIFDRALTEHKKVRHIRAIETELIGVDCRKRSQEAERGERADCALQSLCKASDGAGFRDTCRGLDLCAFHLIFGKRLTLV